MADRWRNVDRVRLVAAAAHLWARAPIAGLGWAAGREKHAEIVVRLKWSVVDINLDKVDTFCRDIRLMWEKPRKKVDIFL